MVNLEYHKGAFCVHTPVFCQEGYCSGCEIYSKKSSLPNLVDQRDGLMLQKAASRSSPLTGVFIKV
jgi:hypothetical protein